MNDKIFLAGESPGKSLYECTNCKDFLVYVQDDEVLPVCHKCGCTEYTNILLDQYISTIEP